MSPSHTWLAGYSRSTFLRNMEGVMHDWTLEAEGDRERRLGQCWLGQVRLAKHLGRAETFHWAQ